MPEYPQTPRALNGQGRAWRIGDPPMLLIVWVLYVHTVTATYQLLVRLFPIKGGVSPNG